MKSWLMGGALLALVIAPSAVCAEVVFDSTQNNVNWWYGLLTYQEEGAVVQLGGTDRSLQSVTLHNLVYMSSCDLDVTASIYAVPSVINDYDVLSNPLWSETVQENLQAGGAGLFATDVYFPAPSITLPNQVVLDFSFNAISGEAALFCQATYAGDRSNNAPIVGQIGSDANYEGFGISSESIFLPASWYNNPAGTMFLYPEGKINAAAVPDPTTMLPLCFGLVGLIGYRRRLGR